MEGLREVKKRLNNEQGLTLAELLATLVVGSLIIILIMSAFVFVQKQFVTQKGSLQENTDISIALKSITRDARLAEDFETSEDQLTLRLIISDEDEDEDIITYTLKNNILKRDTTNYIYDINAFKVESVGEHKFIVTIKSESDKEISTEIVIRGEITNEK